MPGTLLRSAKARPVALSIRRFDIFSAPRHHKQRRLEFLEQFTIGCTQKLRRAGQAERRTRVKPYLEDDLASERDEVLRSPPQADSGYIQS